MKEEYSMLEKTKVGELVCLSIGLKLLCNRSVYSVKRGISNKVDYFKALSVTQCVRLCKIESSKEVFNL